MSDRIDEIFATTLNNYKKTLEDNVFGAFPLFDFMNTKGGAKVLEDTAAPIIVPLMYGINTTVKSYSGYDTFDVTPQGGIGDAIYTMKQIAGTVVIDRFSKRKNAGRSQIINLVSAKMKQLELSFQDALSTMIFADGSGNSSKDIDGLAKLVSDTPTASGTVGGFDQSVYTWWENYQAAGTHTSAAYDKLIADIGLAYNTVSKKKDHPDLIITTQTLYEGIEGLLVKTINYNSDALGSGLRDANLGFENIKYRGTVITYDEDCTASHLYLLNTKYLKLNVDRETDFITLETERPINQDATVTPILWYGNLTVSNRKRQGVLSAVT